MNIEFTYPIGFLILGVCIAFAYTFFMYWFRPKKGELSLNWIKILSSFRFVTVFVLCFLLLKPIVKNIDSTPEKPKFIVLKDYSESVSKETDSLLNQKITEFKKNISDQNLEWVEYKFGDKLYSDTITKQLKSTDINQVLKEISESYYGQNIGGVLLASDGVFNQGYNPLSNSYNFKIYTVGLGSPEKKKNIQISRINNNKIAYKGNKFQVGIDIEAYGYTNDPIKIEVSKNGSVLKGVSEKITSEDFYKQLQVELDANQVGVQKYQVNVSQNNQIKATKFFYIDIIDSKKKILIWAKSPHPDIRVLKEALLEKETYDIEVVYGDEEEINSKLYQGIITHNQPYSSKSLEEIKKIRELNNVWFITGFQTDLKLFNSLNTDVKFNNFSNTIEYVNAYLVDDFSIFNTDENIKNISKYPPLKRAFCEYRINNNGSQIMLNQSIGGIDTENPLWCFQTNSNGKKNAYFLAEGIWQWKIFEGVKYQDESNNSTYTLIQKTVQYLATNNKKERLRLDYPKSVNENKDLIIDAEFYNKNLELNSNAELNVQLKDKNNVEYNYNMLPNNEGYQSKIRGLKPGDYTFKVKAKDGNEELVKNGKFTIKELQLEQLNNQANYNLLSTLSNQSNGVFVPLKDFNNDNLIQLNLEENKMPVVMHSVETYSDLINSKWLFIILLLLLSTEWYLRKRLGAD